MSIKLDAAIAPPPLRATANKNASSGFEDQLRSFLEAQSPEADAAQQARLQMHMCQLQLTRNLFEDAGERPSETLFDTLPGYTPSRRPAIQNGQKFDSRPQTGGNLTALHAPADTCAKQSPVALDGLIERAAADHGLAPDLIRSVIRVESAFDPRAVSSAGARGLMQLMPETAAELGVSDPFDSEQNVMAGSRYLRRLLDRYDGDLDHALAAYNWGMGNVDRHGLQAMPEETRNYLTRVKQT